MASSSSKKMTLKLLVDAAHNKVLFAESGKDFIDFMFSLLLLPLGSIIKVVTPQNMLGSIGKLYQSVDNINVSYLMANLDKSTLLRPTVSSLTGASPLLLTGPVVTPQPKKTHNCYYCSRSIDCTNPTALPGASPLLTGNLATPQHMKTNCCVNFGAENEEEGFLKGAVIYMITDDLEVAPMSAISSITLINRFNMKKDLWLEEKTVDVGMEEGIALLAASLQSVTALTDVFLNSSTKKAAVSQSNAEENFEGII
ncbi:hypothetical protein KSP39_PZI003780 [Platanthera zijinensis]|uniref:DUF674 domain-containing protein n=1 Tax=Platanthera zijinensis TaxID=2320716 RepID=A0AAP0BVK3_9ASPA